MIDSKTKKGPHATTARRRGWLSAAACALLAGSPGLWGCGGSDTGSSATTTTTPATVAALSMTLARGASGEVRATIHASDASGAPFAGATIHVSATSGAAGDVTDKGSGDYEVTVVPTGMDREVQIDAEADGVHAKKTAIALSVVDAGWEQPEAIDGLVNTPGWEDGASVSADGEWLIVASYVPIDILSCSVGGAGAKPLAPDSPLCNTVLGPYAAPERPDMLGGERVLSPTQIKMSCPDLGLPPGGGDAPFAVPPVAAYGFTARPTDPMPSPS